MIYYLWSRLSVPFLIQERKISGVWFILYSEAWIYSALRICVTNQTVIMAGNISLWISMIICVLLSLDSDLSPDQAYICLGQLQGIWHTMTPSSLISQRGSGLQVMRRFRDCNYEYVSTLVDLFSWVECVMFLGHPSSRRVQACLHVSDEATTLREHVFCRFIFQLSVAESPRITLVSALSYSEGQPLVSQSCHCAIRKHN